MTCGIAKTQIRQAIDNVKSAFIDYERIKLQRALAKWCAPDGCIMIKPHEPKFPWVN